MASPLTTQASNLAGILRRAAQRLRKRLRRKQHIESHCAPQVLRHPDQRPDGIGLPQLQPFVGVQRNAASGRENDLGQPEPSPFVANPIADQSLDIVHTHPQQTDGGGHAVIQM